tara:strand:- start:155 stop:526 length:372 start_codon:yes stop_codon:yes gene_type:complete
MSDLTNNSAQTFKTPVTEKGVVPIVTLDANDFPEAVYRIFALDCTTVLVTATLTGGDIIVVADVDAAGAPTEVFETTLTKAKMLDTIVPAGEYIHQFKVTNAAGLELPPVFQEDVTIVRACEA